MSRMDETFDAPDAEDILQVDPVGAAIPVTVDGVVQTDEMPTLLVASRNIVLLAGSRAQKIVSYDPRRKRIVMWPMPILDVEIDLVCVSNSEAAVNSFDGGLLGGSSGNGVMRWEFTFSDELWARPCVIADTGGIYTGIGPSVNDVVLCYVAESWAR